MDAIIWIREKALRGNTSSCNTSLPLGWKCPSVPGYLLSGIPDSHSIQWLFPQDALPREPTSLWDATDQLPTAKAWGEAALRCAADAWEASGVSPPSLCFRPFLAVPQSNLSPVFLPH